MDSHISFKNVTFKRGGRTIFDDLSLEIPRGKLVAIMGPSGTGKTTLLNLISGQVKPDQGDIVVDKQCVNKLSRKQLFILRRKMAMMFQSNALFTNISVFDNIAYPLREQKNLSEAIIRDIVLMKLEAVGLRGARDLMPAQLSGGMARRVALARSIAFDPDLIMYDEPFTGQDPISIGMIVKLIKLLNEAMGMTSLIVTHDIEMILNIADYVYVFADGEIIGQGLPDEIRNSGSLQVQQFMKGLPDGPVPFHYPASDYGFDLLGDEGVK